MYSESREVLLFVSFAED